MDWSLWLMFALTEGVLTVTPGPAVLFVVSQGLRCGTTDALWSAVGILFANALFFALSGTGVGALLTASGYLFTLVKSVGAAYLLYLGATALLRPAGLPRDRENGNGNGNGNGVGVGVERRTLFLRGFILQLSNPKALLFFVAILPQFVDRARPVVPQILVLGVTSILLELLVLSAYGAAAARASRVAMRPRFATATSRLSGVLLVAVALGLLRLER